MQRIFIVGCAKSGTTLLQRLFFSFGDTYLMMGELSLDDFVQLPFHRPTVVGKRPFNTVFSNTLPYPEIERQLSVVRENGVKLLYIEREKSAVLASSGGYVSPLRYEAVRAQVREFGSAIAHRVSFERLVSAPDEVQEELGEVFGLEVRHPFSSYPDFVPEVVFHLVGDKRYKARRIGERP